MPCHCQSVGRVCRARPERDFSRHDAAHSYKSPASHPATFLTRAMTQPPPSILQTVSLAPESNDLPPSSPLRPDRVVFQDAWHACELPEHPTAQPPIPEAYQHLIDLVSTLDLPLMASIHRGGPRLEEFTSKPTSCTFKGSPRAHIAPLDHPFILWKPP